MSANEIGAIIGSVIVAVASYVFNALKTKSMSKDLKAETSYAAELIEKIKSMELELYVHKKEVQRLQSRIQSLKLSLNDRDEAIRMLSYRHEALRESYDDLAGKHDRITLPPPSYASNIKETKK